MGDENGGTVGQTTSDTSNRFKNLIEIDKDFLMNANNMQIVKTIIHECIHAYLNVKLGDPNIGIPIPQLNNSDLASCLNLYYDNFAPDTQSQHDFMYNFMLPSLESILSDVKDLLISPTQNNYISNNISILQPLNTLPITFSSSIPWNWNNYFKYLSLTGLENSNPFKNEIANLTAGNFNIINPVEYYLYTQYNVNANNNIDKSCVE